MFISYRQLANVMLLCSFSIWMSRKSAGLWKSHSATVLIIEVNTEWLCGKYSENIWLYYNGPFLTVNQSMFEVVNQWHSGVHNKLCPTLHKRTCVFVCDKDKACEQLTQEWIENGQRKLEGGDLYFFITLINAEPSSMKLNSIYINAWSYSCLTKCKQFLTSIHRFIPESWFSILWYSKSGFQITILI